GSLPPRPGSRGRRCSWRCSPGAPGCSPATTTRTMSWPAPPSGPSSAWRLSLSPARGDREGRTRRRGRVRTAAPRSGRADLHERDGRGEQQARGGGHPHGVGGEQPRTPPDVIPPPVVGLPHGGHRQHEAQERGEQHQLHPRRGDAHAARLVAGRSRHVGHHDDPHGHRGHRDDGEEDVAEGLVALGLVPLQALERVVPEIAVISRGHGYRPANPLCPPAEATSSSVSMPSCSSVTGGSSGPPPKAPRWESGARPSALTIPCSRPCSAVITVDPLIRASAGSAARASITRPTNVGSSARPSGKPLKSSIPSDRISSVRISPSHSDSVWTPVPSRSWAMSEAILSSAVLLMP